MTDLTQVDARINEVLTTRLISARMPMEDCNRINDEITALRIERVKIANQVPSTNNGE